MLVYEAKLEGTQNQLRQLDSGIRTGLFVRNSIIRAWLDGLVKSRNDAYKHCKTLADNAEFPFCKLLNSQARQAHAERAWASIERFYQNFVTYIRKHSRSFSNWGSIWSLNR
ncbi:hypothetical protein [Nostoc sp.]|uniref:hypothetical protein n=1 Tax=Nostoc sp. TaxID=1180 RepID=UPI002FFB22BF